MAFGAFLLIVFATRFEPLRADNPDFGLVGPGWLALATFSALALFHALVLAAVAGRLSRSLPVLSSQPRTVAAYLPLLFLLLAGPFLLVFLAIASLATLALRVPTVGTWWRSAAAITAGRVVLAAVALLAFPGFARAVRDIIG